MSEVINKILDGVSVREAVQETYDLLEMANVIGRNVKTDDINFSFYFSDKYGMQHGIRVKIKWNPDRFKKPEDGYMELHGDYEYVNSSENFVSEKEIEKARKFFKKYKVLFAAVWEGVVDQSELQAYFREHISFNDLLDSFYFENGELDGIKDLKQLEKVVRQNNLFNMND